jgi:Ca-activated chloride channel family protein
MAGKKVAMTSIRRTTSVLILGMLSMLVACGPAKSAIQPIEISIIYAPESDRYMKPTIDAFNKAYADGNDPLTGKPLPADTRPIVVSGAPGSSGTVMQGIVNAIIAPNNSNVQKPTIYMPAVTHWLSLANLQTGRQVFDVTNSPTTTQDPVVIAIWESRLKAIQAAFPGQDIGWKELIEVMTNPQGWVAYGFTGRAAIYYGHTDPYVSSTGLSTLISEFDACARYKNGFTGRRLTTDQVNNKDVQQCVRDIQSHIRHYSSRTTEFKIYIACGGPEYLDFVALQEDEFLQITQGTPEVNNCKPTDRMVALYPKEGTFYHEHPFAIVNANWVTPEQRQAAEKFRDYVLSPEAQQLVLPGGFRPANPNVPVGFPITSQLGVDPAQPKTVMDVPDPQVIDSVQRSWTYVKRQADIWLVLDISGSMNDENKLVKAREAALSFLDKVEEQNRVGLIVFNTDIKVLVPLDTLETNRLALQTQINGLTAGGGTALFDAIKFSIDQLQSSMTSGNRIPAIIVMTDGEDTDSKQNSKGDLINLIASDQQAQNSLVIIPVGYGSDADIGTLNAIGRASKTTVQSVDPNTVQGILNIIASYF